MSGLQTAPSFSIYTTEDGFAAEEDEMEEVEREKFVTSSERSVTIGESMEEKGSGEFSFEKKGIGLIPEDVEEEEKEVLNEFQELGIEEVQAVSRPPLYLAAGLGMYGDNVGGDGGVFSVGFDGDAEENYQRMVGEDPSNPLFLKNYAQLLQSKGDVHGAEEYFFRATLADPNDGEIQLSYAKFLWELYRDQDRALIYFEQAAHAAPKDSHVLAAVACFLWEVDEDEEEDCAQNDCAQIEEDRGEYYKRMVEENPCNPLFLGNYAHFLYQSKGDLLGAEEYYSRAIVADPSDGEMISKYATLVWELHRDHHKAMSYFERAIQATPEDTHVLAAYANFLWETEDDQEEDEAVQDHDQPLVGYGLKTAQ
ncbi:hypothetical protein U1Q18_030315 [Sarracenia purpurea var. burkii]